MILDILAIIICIIIGVGIVAEFGGDRQIFEGNDSSTHMIIRAFINVSAGMLLLLSICSIPFVIGWAIVRVVGMFTHSPSF